MFCFLIMYDIDSRKVLTGPQGKLTNFHVHVKEGKIIRRGFKNYMRHIYNPGDFMLSKYQ